jgi:hypothetical protein
MSDLLAKIDQATSRLAALQQSRRDREASALAHEEQARVDRRGMTADKLEIEALSAVLHNSRIAKSVDDAQAAACAAQAAAEKALAEAESLKCQQVAALAEVQELLAQLKAA